MPEANPYIGLVWLLIVAGGFLVTVILLASLLGPRHPTKVKGEPFECGARPAGKPSEIRINVQFYLVAMLFILFDIEVIFMYPWAVTLRALGPQAFFAMLSFVIVLGIGLIYVWRKGILNWNNE